MPSLQKTPLPLLVLRDADWPWNYLTRDLLATGKLNIGPMNQVTLQASAYHQPGGITNMWPALEQADCQAKSLDALWHNDFFFDLPKTWNANQVVSCMAYCEPRNVNAQLWARQGWPLCRGNSHTTQTWRNRCGRLSVLKLNGGTAQNQQDLGTSVVAASCESCKYMMMINDNSYTYCIDYI